MVRSPFNATLRDVFILVAVSGTTLALGTMLAKARLTFYALLITLICCLISGLVGAVVAGGIVAGRFANFLAIPGLDSAEAARLESIRASNIIANKSLKEYESKVNVHVIWVLTSMAEFDNAESPNSFKPVISDNCKYRKIKYVYIVPDHIGESAEHALLAGIPTGGIVLKRVPAANWPKLPYSDGAVIFYNPHSDADVEPCHAFFEYPTKDSAIPVWARIETSVAIGWVDRIQNLLNNPNA